MNKKEILMVLDAIGAENIQEGSRNIQCSCFLAPWRKGHRSGTDSRPSMGILINDHGESKIHCFACEYGGTLKDAVAELNKRSDDDFSDIVSLVDDYDNIDPILLVSTIPDYDYYEPKKQEITFGEEVLDDIRGKAHKYLIDRGFELETLKEWESCFDKKYMRAVFPVRNKYSKIVGTVGRTVNNHQVKYFNYLGFDKSKYLFGENKIKNGTSLVVVEGLLDTVKLWQGLNEEGLIDKYSVVGLLGSEPSIVQCNKIRGFANEVILFFDNDKAGDLGQKKLARHIQKQVLLRSVDYVEGIGGDPDEVVNSGYPLEKLIEDSKLIVAKRDNDDWR